MVYALSFLLLILLPFQFVLPVLGFDIPLARLIAAVITGVFLISALSRRSWHLPSPFFSGALLSFLGIVLVSLLWVKEPALAFPKILFLFNLLPLIFVWADLAERAPRQAETLVRVLVLSAGVAAFVGISIFFAQFIFGVSEVFHFMVDRVLPFFLGQELGTLVANYPSLLVNIDGQTVLRVTGFFPDPHVAAFFFGMCGFLALGLARSNQKRRYLFAAAVLFLADILSFSRGGYIGLIVGALTYSALVVPAFSSKHAMRFALVLAFGIVLLGLFGQSVLSRFATSFSLADTSSIERLTLWREAVTTISEHPFIGVGIGNYLSSARPLYQAGTPFYAHNLYLDIAVEIGLIGLLAFIALITSAFRRLFQMRKYHPSLPAFIAALSLYGAHSIFETALFSLHVTMVLALILALSASFKSREA